MLARCLLAQWRGLTPEEQTRIDHDWKMLKARSGGIYYPSLGHVQYTIWRVEGPGHHDTMADQLMSIKIDHWPHPKSF